jgi:hypothetical protein
MTKCESFDIDRVRLELAALPESWEADRDTWPAERSRNRPNAGLKNAGARPDFEDWLPAGDFTGLGAMDWSHGGVVAGAMPKNFTVRLPDDVAEDAQASLVPRARA